MFSRPLTSRRLYTVILRLRNRHLLMLDVVLLLLTPLAALSIHVDFSDRLAFHYGGLLFYTAASIVWKLLVFTAAGIYGRYWRLADIHDVAYLMLPLSIALVLNVTLSLFMLRPVGLLVGLPKSVPFIDGVLTMMAVGGSRFAIRLIFSLETRARAKAMTGRRRTVIAGAGIAGSMTVKEMRMNPHLGLEPVGFVDDDPHKLGIRLHGVQVLGTLKELPEIIRLHNVAEVVVAMPAAPGRVVRGILEACESCGVSSKTIPGVFEILGGRAKVSEIRDIQIEDLLRRGTIQTDCRDIQKVLQKKRVLITGAGGSIGTELCRQIMDAGPAELVLLGHGENSIFQIANELRRNHADRRTKVRAVIADIRDTARIRWLFAHHRPEIIFHAAAHKHVGLMEANIPDAVTNNVLGTYMLLQRAVESGVERFVMISSDKAVTPISIMGVTKRVAELIVRDVAVRTKRPYVSVRFGNVLGSRGSVVPIFRRQIAQGGPVMVTHPEATRFFMTIPEAVQLVLHAAGLGKGGGETFVLDMGEPIRIVDLARDVIRLSGMEEGRDIEVVFTGLKHGEKMHEELFYASEEPEQSANEKIFVCRNGSGKKLKHLLDDAGVRSDLLEEEVNSMASDQLQEDVSDLIRVAEAGDVPGVLRYLKKIVPEAVLVEEDEVLRHEKIVKKESKDLDSYSGGQ